LRLLSLGSLPKRHGSHPDVEILPPGGKLLDDTTSLDPAGYFFVSGYPMRRTGLGLPLLLLTLWMALSLVPLDPSWLESISPRAHSLRVEAWSLVGGEGEPEPMPSSLSPFLTMRSLWIWLAAVAIFYVAVQVARRPERVERLSQLLLLVGVAFGLYGIGQWLLGVQGLLGAEPVGGRLTGLRSTGSFGNPNHYAAFMEMLLLCGFGWLAARWTAFTTARSSAGSGGGRGNHVFQEAGARLFLFGIGIVVVSLGLIFSLSRSGICFALAGCAALVLLTRPGHKLADSATIDLESAHGLGPHGARRTTPGGTRHLYWALGLVVVGVVLWIGIDPILGRFELPTAEFEAERGRWQVWEDSVGAVGDFWTTGSGLSSYRYVFPIYRSFGGQISWSWAHNDYLQLLIELGAPGLVLLIWIMVAVSRRAGRVRRELDPGSPLRHLHAGYCAAALALALHSFTDFSLHMLANAALLSVVLGVVVGLSRREG
jgi:O-antigen ligase